MTEQPRQPIGTHVDYITPGQRYIIRLQRTSETEFRTLVFDATDPVGAPELDTDVTDYTIAANTARAWALMYRSEDPVRS